MLPDAGSWWMVANDHGKQIDIHESAAASLTIGQTEITNTKAYNFEEDQAIVPVILTCTTNNHFLTPGAANEKINSTCISMDMLLDVFTPQLINKTLNSMLRQLEVTLLQKMSEVVCPSTISYANIPSDRRKASQTEVREVQSYKIVSLTSQRFVIESDCVVKQGSGNGCFRVASQLKATIAPSLPPDAATEPVANMIKNLVASMINNGDFDTTERDLGNGIMEVRYFSTDSNSSRVATSQSPDIIVTQQSQAQVDSHGMNTSGGLLVFFTLAGIVYSLFVYHKREISSLIDQVNGYSCRRDNEKNTECVPILPPTHHREDTSGNTNQSWCIPNLQLVTKTSLHAVEVECLEYGCDSATHNRITNKQTAGGQYIEINLVDGIASKTPNNVKAFPKSSWMKELAYSIIELRKLRKEGSKAAAKEEVLCKRTPPPPPPLTYTAQELLQLASLSHMDTKSVLNRSGPFDCWSPENTPPTPYEKKSLMTCSMPPDSSFKLSTLDLTSSEATATRTISDLTRSGGIPGDLCASAACTKGKLGKKLPDHHLIDLKHALPPLMSLATTDDIIIDLKRHENSPHLNSLKSEMRIRSKSLPS